MNARRATSRWMADEMRRLLFPVRPAALDDYALTDTIVEIDTEVHLAVSEHVSGMQLVAEVTRIVRDVANE